MGGKASSSKCTPATLDYIRKKDVNRLTRQLSKRRISFRPKKNANLHSLKLDVNNDEQQRSALHFAAIEGSSIVLLECRERVESLGDATIIVALYEYMHTVDVTDHLGRTPLHYAAIMGNEETLSTLLLCNPDLNRLSKDGTTALHESIIHNHPRVFTLLVQHNADLHLLFQESLPALILAVYLEHRTLVELLIRLGIDPNSSETRQGRSALHYAAYFHQTAAIFHILLSSTVHQLIEINAQDQRGYSVLDYARANVHGSSAIVDLLLQLNVYDPQRGEVTSDEIRIEAPVVKIFQSNEELAEIKKKPKKKAKHP